MLNVQVAENENAGHHSSIGLGSRYLKNDYLKILQEDRNIWQPTWQSAYGHIQQNDEATYTKEYLIDYLSLANRDLMVYNEGELTETHVYDRGFGRVSTAYSYAEGTNPTEAGENIASDTAVNHTEKVVYRTNHLTSSLFAVDENGSVVLHMMYDEWGAPQTDTSWGVNKSGVSNLNNYTGYSYDEVLELYFAQARFYDPITHGFIQEDPIKDGHNWYSYVANNPQGYIDPTGEFFFAVTAAIGAVVGGVVGGVTSAVKSYQETGKVDVKKAVTSAVKGAVAGAVVGAGAGALVAAATGSAVATTAAVGAKVVAGAAAAGGKIAGAVATVTAVASGAVDKLAAGATKVVTQVSQAVTAVGNGIQQALSSGSVTQGVITATSQSNIVSNAVSNPMAVVGLVSGTQGAISEGQQAIEAFRGREYGTAVYHTVNSVMGAFTGYVCGQNLLAPVNVVTPEPETPENETYYRTMSEDDWDALQLTGEVQPTGETFISPSLKYSQGYRGVTVQVDVQPGTTQQLESIGLRSDGANIAQQYPEMPNISGVSGWGSENAFFKQEGNNINIGLGQGPARSIFNSNILNFERLN